MGGPSRRRGQLPGAPALNRAGCGGGGGGAGYAGDGGPGTAARVWLPVGAAVNAAGDLLVSDGSRRVRLVTGPARQQPDRTRRRRQAVSGFARTAKLRPGRFGTPNRVFS